MGERITTDRARELLAGATPGRWVWNMADNGCLTPPDDCSPLSSVAGIVPLGGLARDHYSGPYILEGSEWNGDRWTWARPADAALIAAAPDLAADLIDARAIIRDVSEALNGGESVPETLAADVSALGQRYAATVADLSKASAQIAALTAAQGVPVEVHARAVRIAIETLEDAIAWADSDVEARADYEFARDTLRAAGFPDAQAVAMADGEVTP